MHLRVAMHSVFVASGLALGAVVECGCSGGFEWRVRIEAEAPAAELKVDGTFAVAAADNNGPFYVVERTFQSYEEAKIASLTLESWTGGLAADSLDLRPGECDAICPDGGCPDIGSIVREEIAIGLLADGTLQTRAEHMGWLRCRGATGGGLSLSP